MDDTSSNNLFDEEKALHFSDPELKEIEEKITSFSDNLSEGTSVMEHILSYIQGAGVFPGANLGLAGPAADVGKSYLDAISNLFIGTYLLVNEVNYNQLFDKLKASLMIFSSVQLLAFSYTPWITTLKVAGFTSSLSLAAPALTFASLIDLGITSIDFYYKVKELKFEGWLDERVQEWNHLQKQINMEKEKYNECRFHYMELRTKNFKKYEMFTEAYAVQMDDPSILKEEEILLQKMNESNLRIKGLENKREKLYENISVRCWANDSEDSHDAIQKKLAKMSNIAEHSPSVSNSELIPDESFKTYFLESKTSFNVNKFRSNTDLHMYSKVSNTMKREKAINYALRESYDNQLNMMGVKSLSLIGCLCFMLAPLAGPIAPAFIVAGVVISTFVVCYQLYKNREALKEGVTHLAEKIQAKLEEKFTETPSPSIRPKFS